MHPKQQRWIEEGYLIFLSEGPRAIKIEGLARQVGKNKSSFYHYFTDLTAFIDVLLEEHLRRAAMMAEKEAACTTQQELVAVLVAHKEDLLFNRQLRIHRDNEAFAKCFTLTNEMTGKSIIKLWSEIIDLKGNSYLAALVLRLSLENFFLQITEETLNTGWLNDYFQEVRQMIRAVREAGSPAPLDGSV